MADETPPDEAQTAAVAKDSNKLKSIGNKFTSALNKGLYNNTVGQYSLGGQLIKASHAITAMNKTFISVGQDQMLSFSERFKTFDMMGLSLDESMAVFSEMSKKGIDFEDKTSKATLRMTSNLGLSVGKMAQVLAFNTQTLGLSTDSANNLGRAFIEVGRQYHLSTDVLTGAIISLSKTLIQTSITYGNATSEAVQLAVVKMTGMYGAANKDLIQAAFQQVYGGTAEASKTAAMMGISLDRLVSTNTDVIVSTMQQVMSSLKSKVDPATGQGGSGFIVQPLIEALNGSPALMQLANMGPQTEEQLEKTAEAAEAAVLSNSLTTSLAEIMKNFTVILMPFITSFAGVIAVITSFLFNGNTILKHILTLWVSLAIANKVHIAMTKLRGFMLTKTGMAMLQRLNSIRGINLAMLKQSMANGLPIIASNIASILVTVGTFYGMAQIALGDSLDESEKQTKLLSKKDPNTSLLASIASSMNQSNIYSELVSRLSQDQLDALLLLPSSSTPVVAGTQAPHMYNTTSSIKTTP
tara:strand:- start:705 stop:2282 length:1578 start_codon:yes stop_codon:yes gene_type:complete